MEHWPLKYPSKHYSTAFSLILILKALNCIHIIVAHTLANDKNAILLYVFLE